MVQSVVESRQQILDDADRVIGELDKEYAEKSEAVEQLDSDIKDKSEELESTSEQLAINQQLLQISAEKVAQIKDIDSISIKHTVLGSKVTLAKSDYEKVTEIAKKQIAAEDDNADKDIEINRLTEQVKELQAEQTAWRDERSALRKTIDSLKGKVNELSRNLETLREKYEKVIHFVESLGLKERLDKYLHPKKNIKKQR